MDDVRVRRNSSRPAQLGALAYAHGDEIHLGPGQGQHLPHEAWHIAQQRQGRVRPMLQMRAAAVNHDDALEREADLMGTRALALGRRTVATPRRTGATRVRKRRTDGAATVLQLLNRKAKEAVKSLQGLDKMTPKQRWEAISEALKPLGCATEQNIRDSAKLLKVTVEPPSPILPLAPTFTKQRSVDKEWDHITKGAIGTDGKPTGLHTIHGIDPIAEPFGERTEIKNDWGCYRQSVRLKGQPNQTKKNPSTFFPDDWSLDDIREAIEYALERGQLFEVTRPDKGTGMLLFKNSNSWFPYFG